MDSLDEMITLHYCIIDKSTNLRLDTNEQLDIIYTKNSILVVTTNDSQTMIAVPRLYNEPVCSINDFPKMLCFQSQLRQFNFNMNVDNILLLSGYNIKLPVLKMTYSLGL